MKHLFLGLLSFSLLLIACDSKEDGDKKDADKKKVTKTEVADSVEVEPIVLPLEGVNTVCDCYSQTLALLDEYANNPSEELDVRDARLTVACDSIREDIGDSAYEEEMKLCYEADSISQTLELGDFTSCDCVNSTRKLMDIAGAGKTVPDEINVDMDKCKLLQAKIGMKQYLIEAEECQK
jgi:hypothetical protein